jgi:nitroreductase
MDFETLVQKRRTIRRFSQEPIGLEQLKKLIGYARVAPAGNNIQAVEYIIVLNQETREKLFPLVKWAASLPQGKRAPKPGQEPTGYIIVLLNTKIKKGADFDVGASVENILLGATNIGLAACWMGAIDRKIIGKLLDIPKFYDVKHVISLGYPGEESVVEEYKDSFKYWKDEDKKMHVPKRSLDNIILKIDK